jgi:hypothetical protein
LFGKIVMKIGLLQANATHTERSYSIADGRSWDVALLQ